MRLYNKYRWIANRLQTSQLQKLDNEKLDFSEQDLYHLDIGKRGNTLFLGFYSEEGIKLALEKYGVYKKLQKKGFKNIVTIVDTTDLYKHKLVFYNEKKHKDNLLVELVLRKEFFTLNMPFSCNQNGLSFEGLAIDWLLMQNPYGKFTKKKQPLPGQRFPGLGLSEVVVELLMIVCWRLNLKALINIPDHYHNALFYSKIFYYLDPNIQSQFLALMKAYKTYPLYKISWGIEWGCFVDLREEKEFKWLVGPQIVPFNNDLKEIFSSEKYRDYVHDKMNLFKFKFEEKKYIECRDRVQKETMEKCI